MGGGQLSEMRRLDSVFCDSGGAIVGRSRQKRCRGEGKCLNAHLRSSLASSSYPFYSLQFCSYAGGISRDAGQRVGYRAGMDQLQRLCCPK